MMKHVLSELFAPEATSIIDETREDTTVVVPSPVSKRVRCSDSVPGRSLVVSRRSPSKQHAGEFFIANHW